MLSIDCAKSTQVALASGSISPSLLTLYLFWLLFTQFPFFQCKIASKFITLTESVRDAADIYISLKCPPISFVCDTACTLVRHMNLREPELTGRLWGKFDGCFQEPKPGCTPDKASIIPYSYLDLRFVLVSWMLTTMCVNCNWCLLQWLLPVGEHSALSIQVYSG